MAEPMADNEDKSRSSKESTSGAPLLCQIGKMEMQSCFSSDFKGGGPKKPEQHGLEILGKKILEERFSKLLLGEDMSGCGKGVCTALAISNAITDLCTTVFGQLWRLEPLECEKISMWQQEMEWLLCVSDHIVELVPSWQSLPDGSRFEVMTCRRRSDLHANLPALRKLDHLLLEILDSFTNTDFWYVDQGILVPETDGSSSFHSSVERQEEKWWLPVPCVPPSGLHENSRKQLQQRRDCTNQILKAAMAINNTTLDEMEVPDSYFEALPKNGRACLGDVLYSCIISDQFSPENLLDCLDLSTDFQAIDIANSVEAAIYMWSRKTNMNSTANGDQQLSVKPSWELFKHFITDAEKKDIFVDRAKSILVWLKQLFPGLPQTNLDMCKIQYNKDVGKSILESYSRVLQSLAFNIVARIDDVLYVDDLNKHSTVPKVSLIAHKSIPYLVPISNPPPAAATQSSTAFPLFSPGRSQFADGFVEAKVSLETLPLE